MEIRLATQDDLEAFFKYLDAQMSDNAAKSTPLFQPVSRNESHLDEAMITRFSNGINTEVGEQSWRKLLLAFDGNDVVGHIDIRPHAEAHTEHRALLGMGVDRLYRKQGLGSRLISSIIAWTSENTPIELIDLWVLSSNVAAKQLYIKNGFIQCGEINDMYRIDGQSYSYTVMSRTVQE